MIKFNEFILVLRILLLLLIVLNVLISLPLFFNFSLDKLQTYFINYFFTVYLFFTIFRLIRLIFHESVDIEINNESILVKNIITRKTKKFDKRLVKGFRIERYNWNLVKLSGVRSFTQFESNMVVLYSNYRALAHFKSINYFGTKKIVEKLIANGYLIAPRNLRYFDVYNYKHI